MGLISRVSSRTYRLSRMNRILAHHITTPKISIKNPPLYMLHGVLGNKANFRTPAKKLAEICGCEIITVDARNHGESFHAPVMSYRSMADDIKNLSENLKHEQINILGHSMGGRTVMVAALEKEVDMDKIAGEKPKLARKFVEEELALVVKDPGVMA